MCRILQEHGRGMGSGHSVNVIREEPMRPVANYHKPVSLCLLVAVVALLASAPGALAHQAGKSPVKIFVLAGQSNMQGQGEISPVSKKGTLEYTVANDPNRDYQFLVDANDKWTVWDDVWIHYERSATELITSSLTAGDGVSKTTIGPELGFGYVMGDYFDNQVLIVKAAWGGKSLAVDFRPPSSGGKVGLYYNETLRLVHDAVTNLKKYFPDYDGQGYEITGFGWHQGWNDRINDAYNSEYEFNMANFIRDMREDLGVPNLPFVIATTGMTGWTETNERALSLMKAQLAVAEYPEFKGTVFTVETRGFWHPVDESPADQGYHWNRNAETYLRIGLAMGEAMKDIFIRHLGSGSLLREWWTGIGGTSVSDLTLSPGYFRPPNGTEELTRFQTPANWADHYGDRIRGCLYPPATGEYTFWIASHDDSQLWLSTDPNAGPATLSMIASVSGGTDPCSWDESPSQRSLPVFLKAGQTCYVEALHKADEGADHLAVAWEGPKMSRSIIDGQFLSPWTGAGLPALTVANSNPQTIGIRSATLSGQTLPEPGEDTGAWIYWGQSDGGMSQASWEHVENLGARSDAFNADISGLSPSTTYYFRCYAAGPNSYDWADSSAEFKTLSSSPLVENMTASNVRDVVATLNGQVIHLGEEIPVVTVYWGDNDGKTIAADWDHHEDLGAQGGQFSVTVSGLTPEKVYYFRCHASNSFGGGWAGSTFEFKPRKGRYLPLSYPQAGQ